MRTVLLSTLTLGIAVSSVAAAEPIRLIGSDSVELTQPSRMERVAAILLEFGAEPELPKSTAYQRVELTAAEMDTVTAGLVLVDVFAAAAAQGAAAFTNTNTSTHAATNEWIEIAYGTGDAYAAGDDTAVDVGTSVYGEGDHVIGATSKTIVGVPGSAWGYTTGFVIVLDADHPRFDALQRKYEHLAAYLQRGVGRRVDRLERLGDHLTSDRHKDDERVARLLAQAYAEFVGFADLGYARLTGHANRDYNWTNVLLERRTAD